MTKKLIEVALPLEAINKEAAYEKMPGIGVHPRGLHLWWARRPFTVARAVIWSSLVDDPSAHPEKFPTEEEQTQERNRLLKILSSLVLWKNSDNEEILNEAKAEILKYTGGNTPALLDPFAGGGAIPLEAQRLGLEAHAHDLNPVAVMINKAMIEIPPRFADMPPVNPDAQGSPFGHTTGKGAAGLAEDVEYYGKLMKKEAFKRIGHLYPKVSIPNGGEANVIAWIWARTVKCPNPACGCEMPLAHSFTLSKKKGKEAWIEPLLKNGKTTFKVHLGGKPELDGSINRKGAICPFCKMPVEYPYIRAESRAERMGAVLMAVVAEGNKSRLYLDADEVQLNAADVEKPEDYPMGHLAPKFTGGSCVPYGLDEFHKLFTPRQLTALTTFSDLVAEMQQQATADAVAAGMAEDFVPLADGGQGATAYGQAVGVYLAFAVDRCADFSTSVSRWSVSNEKAMNCFSRQAIPMTWDYPEVNIFGDCVGGFKTIVKYIADCITTLPEVDCQGFAKQFDAQSDCGLRNIMISTDPPYYDNIGYADLSDFFYVWMRRSLKDSYPDLFSTMLVPKTDELVATPYRHDNNAQKAKEFFEDGMSETCKQLYKYACDDIPVTIYYAYKQSETDEKKQTSSNGWETMLSAIINAGFTITGTWPMRTEQTYRSVGMGTNALASSIVLVCRKRGDDARTCTRRDFVTALKRELKPALEKLQQSNIAPVDLAQSAIGPGIGVFSRYKKVLEADGSVMTVRSALQIINQELDMYFSGQDSAIDSDSRLCVELFTQYAYNTVKFGDADVLARAKGTSVARLAGQEVLYAAKGEVRLLERSELPEYKPEHEKNIWMLTQQLTRAMETGGIEACAKIIAPIFGSNAEEAKNLAYRLHSICERKKQTQEAYAYNSLVAAWSEIQSKAAEISTHQSEQLSVYDWGDE